MTVQQALITQTVLSTLVATSVTPTLTQHVKQASNVSQHRGRKNLKHEKVQYQFFSGAANGTLGLWIKIVTNIGGSLPLSAQDLETGLVWPAPMAQMKTTTRSSMVASNHLKRQVSQTVNPFQLRSCLESGMRRERISFATTTWNSTKLGLTWRLLRPTPVFSSATSTFRWVLTVASTRQERQSAMTTVMMIQLIRVTSTAGLPPPQDQQQLQLQQFQLQQRPQLQNLDLKCFWVSFYICLYRLKYRCIHLMWFLAPPYELRRLVGRLIDWWLYQFAKSHCRLISISIEEHINQKFLPFWHPPWSWTRCYLPLLHRWTWRPEGEPETTKDLCCPSCLATFKSSFS